MAHSSDSEYNPRLEDATSSGVPDTTPSSRAPRDSQIPQSARNRVQCVDPNQGRCLIENCDEYRCVEFCHCFPRNQRKNSDLLCNVEWHWNMQIYTLNIDTRRNIFRAGAALHGLHDKNAWFLLPEERIINRYYETVKETADGFIAERRSFPNIPDRNDFDYRFVVLLPAMRKIAIHRQLDTKSAGADLSPNDFVTYIYPFETIPKLTSHLHPKFAILEAGRKLEATGALTLLQVTAKYPILSQVLAIYSAWTRQHPADAKNDPGYNPPDDNSDDHGDSGDNDEDNDTDSAVHTRPDRLGRRKRRAAQGSPTHQSKRGRRAGHKQGLKRKHSAYLSEKTLVMLNREYKKIKWTEETVQRWSKRCCPLSPSDHLPWRSSTHCR